MAMKIFPEMRKLWNEWQLRGMVLLSLSLQIILIILGNRRRYTLKNWLRIGILWLTYLCADSVATVSLGILSRSQGDSELDSASHPDSVIATLWAPFLLLHLGGPDTMTAFSLEDNELWLRHLLGLVIQVVLVLYVFIRSWTIGTYKLLFLAIPMFVAGSIKYVERTTVLWFASSGHFRDSLFPRPNPGLDYVEIIEKYGDILPGLNFAGYERCRVDPENNSWDAKILDVAFYFFKMFRRLYADLIFSFVEIQDSYGFFSKIQAEKAFEIIELELGFLYDVLFTKAPLVYSLAGIILRSISFISIVSAFVGFLIINKHSYSKIDVIISYVLFAGAIALEIIAVTLLLSSEWTMLWLNKHESRIPNRIYQAISSLRSARNGNKRWSQSIAQFNLIDFCLRYKPTKCPKIRDLFGIYEELEKYQQLALEDFSPDLQEYVFKHIKQNCEPAAESADRLTEMCSRRSDEVLRKFNTYDILGWSVEVDFDESILLWHIATDLFYYSENKKSPGAIPESEYEISKVLSNYMLYLLVMRPFMLPKGIGQIRFEDTKAAVVRVFQDSKFPSTRSQNLSKKEGIRSQARMDLLQVDSRYRERIIKGDSCKSALFDGCRLARLLDSLETEDGREIGWKWEMISNVWVEMLCYAANQCRWNYHAQRLGRGGELLTHVSLLMAHLGLTENLKVWDSFLSFDNLLKFWVFRDFLSSTTEEQTSSNAAIERVYDVDAYIYMWPNGKVKSSMVQKKRF